MATTIQDNASPAGARICAPGKSRPVVFEDGRTYKSIKAACEDNEVSYGRVKSWISTKGISAEEAIELVKACPREKSMPVTFKDGRTYRSIRSACADNEVSYGQVKTWVREKGISAEEAIELAKKAQTRKKPRPKTAVTLSNGHSYDSLSKACKGERVAYDIMQKYVRERNLTPAEAIEAAIRDGHGVKKRIVGPDGTVYDTLKDAYEAEGISSTTIIKYMNEGLDFAAAVNKVRENEKNHRVEYKGKIYPTLTGLCESQGVPCSNVSKIMSRGKTLEQAISIAKKNKRERTPVNIGGKVFRSRKQACEEYGVSWKKVKHLMDQESIDFETAIAKAPKIEKGVQKTYAVTDHKGRKFDTLKEFSRSYGVYKQKAAEMLSAAGVTTDSISDYVANRIKHGSKMTIASFAMKSRVSGPYFMAIDPDGHECVMHIDELYDRHFAEIGFSEKEEISA